MTHEKSITLHQQDGGMSVQAFADKESITLAQARYYVKTGRVIGARQDARSKKWTIYPPAKLAVTPRSRVTSHGQITKSIGRLQAAGFDVGTSPHGLSAGLPVQVQETPEASSLGFHAKPVLTFAGAALPAEATCGRGASASPQAPQGRGRAEGCPMVYRSPEVQGVLCALREAAARQFREGLHYLRLDAREFAQLYAVLDNERSRVRKLVGKGLVDMANLRASDSIWQKMQAMSREGRLL